MKIKYLNIFGSTGVIGVKTLNLVEKKFPKIKINLLVANNNYKLLIKQYKKYKPRFIFLIIQNFYQI